MEIDDDTNERRWVSPVTHLGTMMAEVDKAVFLKSHQIVVIPQEGEPITYEDIEVSEDESSDDELTDEDTSDDEISDDEMSDEGDDEASDDEVIVLDDEASADKTLESRAPGGGIFPNDGTSVEKYPLETENHNQVFAENGEMGQSFEDKDTEHKINPTSASRVEGAITDDLSEDDDIDLSSNPNNTESFDSIIHSIRENYRSINLISPVRDLHEHSSSALDDSDDDNEQGNEESTNVDENFESDSDSEDTDEAVYLPEALYYSEDDEGSTTEEEKEDDKPISDSELKGNGGVEQKGVPVEQTTVENTSPDDPKIHLTSLSLLKPCGEDVLMSFALHSLLAKQVSFEECSAAAASIRSMQSKKDEKIPELEKEILDVRAEYLFEVIVFKPAARENWIINKNFEPAHSHSIQLLGCHTVEDLIGAIHCENDCLYVKDITNPKEFKHDPALLAKNVHPSCMIQLHDTIYSVPGEEVYHSSVINEYIESRGIKNIMSFKQGDLKTKLKDISIQFGFPYVYMHFMNCMHLIMFRRARQVDERDPHLVKHYPRVPDCPRQRVEHCRLHERVKARWSVVGHKSLPEDPMFLCTSCMYTLCYNSKRDTKRGTFKLYPLSQFNDSVRYK